VRHDFAFKTKSGTPADVSSTKSSTTIFGSATGEDRVLGGELVHGRASTSTSAAASGRERIVVQ